MIDAMWVALGATVGIVLGVVLCFGVLFVIGVVGAWLDGKRSRNAAHANVDTAASAIDGLAAQVRSGTAADEAIERAARLGVEVRRRQEGE